MQHETPSTTSESLVIEYIGFWKRTAASIIDSILITLVTAPILIQLYGVEYFQSTQPIYGSGELLLNYLFPAIAVLVFWHFRSATPGKMLFNARVVDAKSFGKPSTGQLIGRYLGYYLSILGLGLGFLWIIWDKRKQGWHDKLAGTLVIREYE
ncbi:putative membrane protein YckC, RDD family [endosymbiont of Ridgeia piscesae]|jgi:uncharacterized RDD family membrane protein YckC|uniref:Putative membrane protein YckC, RDD family n=2 Tax=endosymbiont of Ridgeia piscesae TaxID=54398 RepID=A0A0T5YU70_9GAMM|nr:RDD family protein [endosymbiont of Ridgeia piscesae]KRT54159.1 putative membrane protein YckC, RDD family [endosymbiont of Ridgeia piscesae]